MSELKPCPFCGGEAGWSQGEQKTKYGNEQVYCVDCFAQTPPDSSKREAAEWWNPRVDDAKLKLAVEALEHYSQHSDIFKRADGPTVALIALDKLAR